MPDILNEDYTIQKTVQAEPICGEDFCGLWGDCLACFGGDTCPEGGHSWVVYSEDTEKFYTTHEVKE